MALKMDLKAIFFMGSCYNLMQIATRIVESEQNTNEQSMNGYWDARRGSLTHNHSTRSFLKK
jgi:hypothetical protein